MRDALEFYVVRVGQGRLTPSLWNMNVGDELFMNPKITGHFTLEGVPENRTLVMVGTGTGLAPFRSMYLTYRNQNRWNKFVLLDGCREARDLGYFDQLTALAAEDPTFVYLPTVTPRAQLFQLAWPSRPALTPCLNPPPSKKQWARH